MPECAVITRTRSRPLMLERAAASIAAQTYRDFQWVLVNDAGDRAPVEHIADQARRNGVDVLVLHRDLSTGMEAASNAGIRASQSAFIAIHDDDDSWAPEFLERTAALLRGTESFAGVTAHAARITETIAGSRIRRIKAEPHKPVLVAVQLADMLRSNLFPPISFLYRRRIFDALGGYDETMKILGDWDFNLRALLVDDIAVLPEHLANYHVRSAADAPAAYANSVPPGASGQAVADARFRNSWLRKDIAEGKAGLGVLLALGRLSRERSPFENLVSKLRRKT
jgi:glycosyltransferase involved in cell wall biosynthesis